MINSKTRVMDMIPGILECLRNIGLSEASIWGVHHRTYRNIAIFFEEHNKEYFDIQILRKYIDQAQQNYESGSIGRGTRNIRIKAAERLSDFYRTGNLKWYVRPRGTCYILPESLEQLINQFINQTAYTDNTKGDVRWAIRKYLCFIERKEYTSFMKITLLDIQEFLVHCSSHMKGGSIRNIRGYIYKFHSFLFEQNMCPIDITQIPNIKIVRENQISPYLTQDELKRTLAQINRSSSVGKRNYAIIILAMQTGMRADDIVNLRLSDIDWRNAEIHMLQHKTMAYASLPLTKVAGEAIKEYILYGRPNTDSEYVFLRANSPFQRFHDGIAIQTMFNDYQHKAGIKRAPYDGKGFHGIRRLLGHNMATNGIPVNTISQVLGHISNDAVTQYIALDSEQLRECALSFEGIEVDGRY